MTFSLRFAAAFGRWRRILRLVRFIRLRRLIYRHIDDSQRTRDIDDFIILRLRTVGHDLITALRTQRGDFRRAGNIPHGGLRVELLAVYKSGDRVACRRPARKRRAEETSLIQRRDRDRRRVDRQRAVLGCYIIIRILTEGDGDRISADVLARIAGKGVGKFFAVHSTCDGSGQLGIGLTVNLGKVVCLDRRFCFRDRQRAVLGCSLFFHLY